MTKTTTNTRPVVLLLAAGRARRFGGDKRKTPINAGSKLIAETIACYSHMGFKIIVCLSADAVDEELAQELRSEDTEILHCANSNQGMGATLAEGISACEGYPGVFVALGDMPAIRGSTLAQLEKRLHPEKIVFPRFRERRGHPVLFGSGFFTELRELRGDRGASQLIADHPRSVHAIDVDDPGVVMDVDTKADLRTLEIYLQSRSSSGVSG